MLLLFIVVVLAFPALEALNDVEKYKYTSCIMTRVKNVDYQLEEWFTYHLAIGVNRFIIADDCSNDGGKTMAILEKYEKLGVLTLYRKNPHLDCANFQAKTKLHLSYMVNREKSNCHWMASIDSDEYIFPTQVTSKVRFLNDVLLNQDFPLIRMVMYAMANKGEMLRSTEPALIHHYRYGNSQPVIKNFAKTSVVSTWHSAHYPQLTNFTYHGVEIGKNWTGIGTREIDRKQNGECWEPTGLLYIRHFKSMTWQDYQARIARPVEATGVLNRYANDTIRHFMANRLNLTAKCDLPGSEVFLPTVLRELYPSINATQF